jgi:hypothetical protein
MAGIDEPVELAGGKHRRDNQDRGIPAPDKVIAETG